MRAERDQRFDRTLQGGIAFQPFEHGINADAHGEFGIRVAEQAQQRVERRRIARRLRAYFRERAFLEEFVKVLGEALGGAGAFHPLLEFGR